MGELGFSDCMGPELRTFVEEQLVADLELYLVEQQNIHRSEVVFDWSDSCIEGHRTHWLDGEIENFSGISILDTEQSLIAEGWMEFIETEDGLEVFWWFLRGGDLLDIRDRVTNTVPSHVWERLSSKTRARWSEYAPSQQHA